MTVKTIVHVGAQPPQGHFDLLAPGPSAKWHAITLDVGSATLALEVASASADVVYAHEGLAPASGSAIAPANAPYAAHARAMLAEFGRVLKPDGLLVLTGAQLHALCGLLAPTPAAPEALPPSSAQPGPAAGTSPGAQEGSAPKRWPLKPGEDLQVLWDASIHDPRSVDALGPHQVPLQVARAIHQRLLDAKQIKLQRALAKLYQADNAGDAGDAGVRLLGLGLHVLSMLLATQGRQVAIALTPIEAAKHYQRLARLAGQLEGAVRKTQLDTPISQWLDAPDEAVRMTAFASVPMRIQVTKEEEGKFGIHSLSSADSRAPSTLTLSSLLAKVAREGAAYREAQRGARFVTATGRPNMARTYLLRRLAAFWTLDLKLANSPESLAEIAGVFLQGTKFAHLAIMDVDEVRSALKEQRE